MQRLPFLVAAGERKAARAASTPCELPCEIIFGADNVTTGAGNDIQQATNLAKRMVKEFGFSEKLGPLRYENNQEEVFLGHSVSQQTNISDEKRFKGYLSGILDRFINSIYVHVDETRGSRAMV